MDNIPDSSLTELNSRLAAEAGRVLGLTSLHALGKTSPIETPGGGLAFPSVGPDLEAILIVGHFQRPALLVRNATYEPPSSAIWRSILDPHRSKIENAIRSAGRLELIGHPTLDYAGTAWMVAENIAVTSRQVAQFFSRNTGSSRAMLVGPLGPVSARIDFREEFRLPASLEIPVEKVLFIAEPGRRHPDIALLKLVKGFRSPDPVPLLEGRVSKHQLVAVIGYPANDPRNPSSAVAGVSGGAFDAKRLSPGQVTADPRGFLLTHDCCTLGGSSGSLVLDIATGHAAGLHFSGSFRKDNHAVDAAEIRKILSRLKIQVTVPFEAPPAPVIIEKLAAQDLSTRAGYQSDFLGRKSAVHVPLPRLSQSIASDLAPVQGIEDSILRYTHFSIAMSAARRMAFYTACNIDGKTSLNLRRRVDRWALDPRLDRAHQADNELYRNNDLDRGHLVRRLDPVWGDPSEAERAHEDTFFYTNAAPQHARLNQGHWNDLEDYILNNANALDLRVSVFTGPVFLDDDPEYRGFRLPQRFWKVVAVVNGETGKLHATAYMLSQRDLLTNIEFVFGQFRTYQVPISEVERQTHLSFGKLRRYDPLKDRETFAIREIALLRDIVLI